MTNASHFSASSSFTPRVLLALALSFALACGDDDSAPDTSPMDSGAEDAAEDTMPDDTGAEDGGEDSGGTDAMLDAEPDTGPEACEEDGETRLVSCGFCGRQSQLCDRGVWIENSECLMEGDCAEGSVETRRDEMCREEMRLCNDRCRWLDWEETAPAGECRAGTERMPEEVDPACPEGSSRTIERCNDSCVFEEVVGESCQDGCGVVDEDTLGTGFARRVCIPEGPFLLATTSARLEWLEVPMSAYRIDKFPVSCGRYRECVAAGACERRCFGSNDLSVPGFATDAEAFCEWTGGHLTTLAEFVKAGRGPLPRRNRTPWWNGHEDEESNDYFSCETVPTRRQALSRCPERIPDTVSQPETISVFGVEGTFGTSGVPWVSDRWVNPLTPGEYEVPDPRGPESGRRTLLTGDGFDDRNDVDADEFGQFRCAYGVRE